MKPINFLNKINLNSTKVCIMYFSPNRPLFPMHYKFSLIMKYNKIPIGFFR